MINKNKNSLKSYLQPWNHRPPSRPHSGGTGQREHPPAHTAQPAPRRRKAAVQPAGSHRAGHPDVHHQAAPGRTGSPSGCPQCQHSGGGAAKAAPEQGTDFVLVRAVSPRRHKQHRLSAADHRYLRRLGLHLRRPGRAELQLQGHIQNRHPRGGPGFGWCGEWSTITDVLEHFGVFGRVFCLERCVWLFGAYGWSAPHGQRVHLIEKRSGAFDEGHLQKSDAERHLHGVLATPCRRASDTSPP